MVSYSGRIRVKLRKGEDSTVLYREGDWHKYIALYFPRFIRGRVTVIFNRDLILVTVNDLSDNKLIQFLNPIG